MEVKELHIYGYGKLENVRFQLSSPQVFLGENEAGKSTIMSFIHSVLFGFPKAGGENRYEPKHGGGYGGSLLLETRDYGEVRIERVKGKSAGDVTVRLTDGRSGKEELLSEILNGMDKSYFQAIFSFNLDGLQGLGNLDEGTVGRYLLSAGLAGNDRLMEAEAELSKDMEALFKPSGQKPVLNASLTKLKDIYGKLKAAEKDQQSYGKLVEEEKKIAAEIHACKQELQKNEEDYFLLKEFVKLQPLAEEKAVIEEKLGGLSGAPLLTDGLRRFERLEEKRLELESRLAALLKRKSELEQDADGMAPDRYLTENREQIETLIDAVPLLEKMDLEEGRLSQQADQCKRETDRLAGEIGSRELYTSAMLIETNAFIKERVKGLERKKQALQAEKQQLDEQYKIEQTKLEQSEKRLGDLRSRQLPEARRRELEKEAEEQGNASAVRMRRGILKEQIEAMKAKYERQKGKDQAANKRSSLIRAMLLLICGLAAGAAVFLQEWTAAAIAGVVFILLLAGKALFAKEGLSEGWKQQLDELERQYKALGQSEGSLEKSSRSELLMKDRELQEAVRQEMYRFEERMLMFDQSIERYEKWEHEWKTVMDEAGKLLKEWGIPAGPEECNLETVYDLICQLKVSIQEREAVSESLRRLQEETAERKVSLIEASACLGGQAGSWREAASYLKKALKEDLERSVKETHIQEELASAAKSIGDLQSKQDAILREIYTLLEKAGAEDEESFRREMARAEERNILEERLRLLIIQLGQSKLELETADAMLRSGIGKGDLEEAEKERGVLSGKLQAMVEVHTELKHKIRELEAGGVYEEWLQQYQTEKALLNEKAWEWGRLALAKALLERTIDTFRQQRLPAVISKAEEYLALLTEGRYISLRLNQGGNELLAERQDHVLFEADEVSTGTAEQIYASIRLALADSVYISDPPPLIIDDGFVNFDPKRSANMIRLLKKIGERRQIIFFTCHPQLAEPFGAGHVEMLNKVPADV